MKNYKAMLFNQGLQIEKYKNLIELTFFLNIMYGFKLMLLVYYYLDCKWLIKNMRKIYEKWWNLMDKHLII